MSGGPPHHPHSRPAPPTNTAWNHLQVPNYFPTRQPQHAHMSNEHSLLHQPTWHTPTTEPMKTIPHSHIFSLEQMLSERQFPPRHTTAPGVDLSVTRNGSQNGEISTNPISLSVRDTNKINSLPPSALDIQPVEVGLKPQSPVLKSLSPGLSDGSKKRSSKRVDSILERLNPGNLDKPHQDNNGENAEDKSAPSRGVIVQATGSQDENSNSSSTLNVSTPTNIRDDEVVSPYSNNEDSLDSSKSRRKRKPSKTVRVPAKEDEGRVPPDSNQSIISEADMKKEDLTDELQEEVAAGGVEQEKNTELERRTPAEETPTSDEIPAKTRRKTSEEDSETIDNIAAMVQEGLKEKEKIIPPSSSSDSNKEPPAPVDDDKEENKAAPVSVIKTNLVEDLTDAVDSADTTTIQKKSTNTHFVEVENKLEEMFAGIEDTSSDPVKAVEENNSLAKLPDEGASTSQDNVTSTSNDLLEKGSPKKTKRKYKRSVGGSRRNSETNSIEAPIKEKMTKGKKKAKVSATNKTCSNKVKKAASKVDAIKDIYAYDSGSNASSSRSRGPFIHIRGPRDSPISVSVVNTPTEDEDKKPHKTKKYHDDSEYRHKVRSKGLHCSTLSNQYDAQTKDVSWICAFCKRGPHATEISGPTLNGLATPPGDLFGPYFIATNCPEFERRLSDPYDKQFKSKKIARALENGPITTVTSPKGKKSKRKHSDGSRRISGSGNSSSDDIYLGITDTSNGTFEIWAHEDCIVWSAGVYLVGPKIIGLEEAVWTCCNVTCEKCHLKGANICCIKRGCTRVAHVCCARLSNWQFNEDNYKTFCPEHWIDPLRHP